MAISDNRLIHSKKLDLILLTTTFKIFPYIKRTARLVLVTTYEETVPGIFSGRKCPSTIPLDIFEQLGPKFLEIFP